MRILFFLTALIFCAQVIAQQKNMLGAESAYLSNNFSSDLNILYKRSSGLSMGVFYQNPLNNRAGKSFEYKIGIYYENKGSKVNTIYIEDTGQPFAEGTKYNVLKYWTAPLSIFYFPFNGRIFFLEVGVYGSYLSYHFMNSNPMVYSIIESEPQFQNFQPERPESFKKYDFGYLAGMGWNFEPTAKTRFRISLKYAAGFTNINDDPNFDGYLKNNSISIALAYSWAFSSEE